MIDRHPAVIVRCADTRDVRAVVDYAPDSGRDLAVRGGGHSVPGFGTADGAIVADLSPLNDGAGRPASAGRRAPAAAPPGAMFNDATATPTGWRPPAASCPRPASAASRSAAGSATWPAAHGLSCDNLLSAEVVTADGRIVDRQRDASTRTCSGRCAAAAGTSAS